LTSDSRHFFSSLKVFPVLEAGGEGEEEGGNQGGKGGGSMLLEGGKAEDEWS